MTVQRKAEALGAKPVLVPLCPPNIPCELDLVSNPVLSGDRPVTNRFSHGATLQYDIRQYYVLNFCAH